jgi:oligopeptide transport system ATP-binding protein
MIGSASDASNMADSPLPHVQEASSSGRECDRLLLSASNLNKTYNKRRWLSRGSDSAVVALQDVSLSLGRGQTLGIVGESGAGKSTLARCLACLDPPDSGEIRLEGRNLLGLTTPELRRARRHIQLIFQGSAASLNARFSALEIVSEPAVIAGLGTKAERHELALAMMESVGLPRGVANRRCTEFSGGQRQRLAIARALTLSPRILVLDESLADLDLLIQAQLINLLSDLQAKLSIGYVFISHDLRLAAHIADELAVMHSGRIVEKGRADQVSQHPGHPHTRELLAAAAQFVLPS